MIVRRYVGKLGTSHPLAIAERAIGVAEELSDSSKARFTVHIDSDDRIHATRCSGRKINPHGWIATFNRKSDPDWLAEEIEGWELTESKPAMPAVNPDTGSPAPRPLVRALLQEI